MRGDGNKLRFCIITILATVFVLSIIGMNTFSWYNKPFIDFLCFILFSGSIVYTTLGFSYVIDYDIVTPKSVEYHVFLTHIVVLVDGERVFSFPKTSKWYHTPHESIINLTRKKYRYNLYGFEIKPYKLICCPPSRTK